MRSRWTVRLGCSALTAAVVAAAPVASAQGTRRVSLTKRDEAAVERAREGAARRLADAECRKVFSDFHDAKGRTIEQNLEAWAVGPAEYLRLVAFVDGSGETLCRREDVKLVSIPNVPRVIVCPGFASVQRLQPGAAANMVIHEALHTLGLGENPPTSMEITRRVEVRCR
jgi:hypothetical protein